METENILTSIINKVGIITLNNELGGAISNDIMKELALQIAIWNNDDNVTVIIVRGQKEFSSGIAVSEITPYAYEEIQRCFTIINNCQKPIIASVKGNAVGIGFELALTCDFILASYDAKFAYPEITIGMIPCFGGLRKLARTIGKSKTSEAVFTGKVFTAEEAEKCGIVSRIVPAVNLLEDTIKTAERIATQNEKTLRIAKQTINAAFNTSGGIELERSNGELCLLNNILE